MPPFLQSSSPILQSSNPGGGFIPIPINNNPSPGPADQKTNRILEDHSCALKNVQIPAGFPIFSLSGLRPRFGPPQLRSQKYTNSCRISNILAFGASDFQQSSLSTKTNVFCVPTAAQGEPRGLQDAQGRSKTSPKHSNRRIIRRTVVY